MKTHIALLAVIAALGCAGLTGCGIKQQVVRVDVPNVHVNPSSGPLIVVNPVKDDRSDAIVMQFPSAQRAKNVGGLLRNGSGIQVNLESATAATKARAIIIQALRGMGYRTTDDCASACPAMDVTLHRFSVQAPFQFWRAMSYSQHMLADISADVSIDQRGKRNEFSVSGHGSNVYQIVSQENWEIALNRAVKDFIRNFQSAMAAQ